MSSVQTERKTLVRVRFGFSICSYTRFWGLKFKQKIEYLTSVRFWPPPFLYNRPFSELNPRCPVLRAARYFYRYAHVFRNRFCAFSHFPPFERLCCYSSPFQIRSMFILEISCVCMRQGMSLWLIVSRTSVYKLNLYKYTRRHRYYPGSRFFSINLFPTISNETHNRLRSYCSIHACLFVHSHSQGRIIIIVVPGECLEKQSNVAYTRLFTATRRNWNS